jgi:hypothetical protein
MNDVIPKNDQLALLSKKFKKLKINFAKSTKEHHFVVISTASSRFEIKKARN